MTTNKLRIGVVMDPIESISPKKDSSFAMLLEAQRRGHEIWVMGQGDLRLEQGVASARMSAIRVTDDTKHWFDLVSEAHEPLSSLDVILMRKDPPFDMEFVYTTYILERAEETGVLVVNKPASLRDMNEKAYTAWFADLCPDTLISRSMDDIRQFLAQRGHIVVKPLDGMGGRSIFTLKKGDTNTNVVLETLTDYGHRFAMAQAFLPAIKQGDKRVLLVDGEPISHMLARIPNDSDGRGNLVMGATGEVREIGPREREIAQRVGAVLRERGVLFAGLDIIGDSLTEINVTSPTGIREIDKHCSINISGMLFDAIEQRLAASG